MTQHTQPKRLAKNALNLIIKEKTKMNSIFKKALGAILCVYAAPVFASHQCGPIAMQVWVGANGQTLKSHSKVCDTWKPFITDRNGPGWNNFAYSILGNDGHAVTCYWQNNEEPYNGEIRHLNTGGVTRCAANPVPEQCETRDESSAGNPCNVSNGNKHQAETDIDNARLGFTRTYNSRFALFNNNLGQGWSHNYQPALRFASGSDYLDVVSGAGTGERWQKVAGVWQGKADTKILLTQQGSAPNTFTLTRPNQTVETYSSNGEILSKVRPNGESIVYSYDAVTTELTTVVNSYGDSLAFVYSQGQLASVTDAAGTVYRYEYDDFDNLVYVVLPDLTPANNVDNPRRTYHYENTRYPYHLTGITDENGNRYATYAYDVSGKAVSTEHAKTTNAVGQERFELDY